MQNTNSPRHQPSKEDILAFVHGELSAFKDRALADIAASQEAEIAVAIARQRAIKQKRILLATTAVGTVVALAIIIWLWIGRG